MRWRVVLLLCLAVGVALLVRWAVVGTSPGSIPEVSTPDRAHDPADDPVLQGSRAADARRSPHVPASPAAEEEAPNPARAARYVVEGRLRGFDEEVGGIARVAIVGLGRTWSRPTEPHRGHSDRAGRFRIDASTVLGAQGDASELEIRVDHPFCVPAVTRVEVRPGWQTAPPPFVHEVEIKLVRAALIAGRVEDASGRPVPGAALAVYALGPDGPEPEDVGHSTCGPDGDYRFRALGVGRAVVLAAVPGLRPASTEVDLMQGLLASAPPLVLRPGVGVAGHVRLASRPQEGAKLEVTRLGEGTRCRLGPMVLGWSGDGFEHALVRASTDARGRYEVTGLLPGPCSVAIDDLPFWLVTNTFQRWATVAVDAPAQDADLDLRGATLDVEIQSVGAETGPTTLLLMVRGAVHCVTVDHHGLHVLTAPHDALQVTTSDERYESATFELQAPADGEHLHEVLELQRRVPRPGIRVRLEARDGAPIPRAGFAVFAGGERGPFPLKTWDVDGKDGVFELTEAPPGRALLVVRAGGGFRGGDAHYLEASQVLDVPPRGSAEVELTVELGGRLRIRAQGQEGQGLAAGCEIRAEDGSVVDVHFVARTPNSYSVSNTLDAEVPSNVEPALRPGAYTVEITADGYTPRIVRAIVRRGETTNIDEVLEPR